jgi:hypothetical protein
MRAAAHPHYQPQRQGAREQAQGGETGGIDAGVFQGQAAQQRVARKGDHRQEGQQGNAAGRNRNPAGDRPFVSVLDGGNSFKTACRMSVLKSVTFGAYFQPPAVESGPVAESVGEKAEIGPAEEVVGQRREGSRRISPAKREAFLIFSVSDTSVPDCISHEILVLKAALKGPGNSLPGNGAFTQNPLVMAFGSAVIRKRPPKLPVDAIHRGDFIVRPDLRHAEIGNPMDPVARDRARRRGLPVCRLDQG